MSSSIGLRRTIGARRHPDDDKSIDVIPRPIAWRHSEIPNGRIIERHHHIRAQLLYGASGIMMVETDDGFWIVPPHRAVWVPPLMEHEVTARGAVSLRNLYFDPQSVSDLPKICSVVTVSPLLREMVLRAINLPALYDLDGPDGRFLKVLLDQIRTLPTTPLHLPMSDHPRLKPITNHLSKNPADRRSLEDWAAIMGASTRTLTRLFQKETGMSFRQWRQQARLLEALIRLAAGTPVTNVALDLGYDSQSAFIAMFKKALGKTPGKYFTV